MQLAGDAFLETLEVPLIEGRMFDARDHGDSPPVLVVNQTAARELFGEESAVGKRLAIGIGLTEHNSAEIIGVIGDVLYEHPAIGVMPEAYVHHRQEPDRQGLLMVRSYTDPATLVPAIRAELAAMQPGAPLVNVETLEEISRKTLGDTRLMTQLLLAFALLGLVLAASGTYGVVAYWVSQRKREFGVRLALGARASQVTSLVLRLGLRIAALGVVVGAIASFFLTRFLRHLLYEVGPNDPAAFLAAISTLLVVVALADYLPARRATQVDPARTLRAE